MIPLCWEGKHKINVHDKAIAEDNIGFMGKSELVKFELYLSTKKRMEDPKPWNFIYPHKKEKKLEAQQLTGKDLFDRKYM